MSNEHSSRESLTRNHAVPVRTVTLGRISFICALTFGLSLAAIFAWMVLGMLLFSVRDSEVPWYYPVGVLLTVVTLASFVGLVSTGIIALLRRLGRGRLTS
jgi:hypothetical protein